MPLELKAEQKALARAIQLVAKALPTRPALPVLAGILLEARGEEAWLRSTDLELSLQVKMPAAVLGTGRAVVPGHYTAEAVRYLPEGEVTIREEEQRLKIEYGAGETVVSTYDAAQFPSFPEIESGRPIMLTATEWQSLLRQVVIACGHDDVQPLFTGVLWEIAPGKPLSLVATDTHRLAVLKLARFGSDQNTELRAVVPRRVIEVAARLAQGLEEAMAINVGKLQVAVESEGFCLVSRLIEAKYPNYEGVIPREIGTRVTFEVDRVFEALERAALLVREEEKPLTNVVRLAIGDGSLVVSGRGATGSMVEPLTVATEGAQGVINFNVRYLLEGLKALSGEMGIMMINKEFSAVVLRAVEDDSYTHLLLPVMLQGSAAGSD